MSLGLTELELQISERLQPLRLLLQSEQTLVRMLPEEAEKYQNYEDKGVEVVISSSRATAPEVSGRQEVDIDVVCRIVSPKRYTDNPATQKAVCEWMLDGCYNYLVGFSPKFASKPIYFVSHVLQIPEGGRWTIIATFRFTKTVRVTTPPSDTDPLIKLIIANDAFGEIVNAS